MGKDADRGDRIVPCRAADVHGISAVGSHQHHDPDELIGSDQSGKPMEDIADEPAVVVVVAIHAESHVATLAVGHLRGDHRGFAKNHDTSAAELNSYSLRVASDVVGVSGRRIT